MKNVDKRIDAYIAKAAPFAQPILNEVRARVHASCPDVVETIKWGKPAFEHHGPMAFLAAFKEHCAFGFWNGERIVGASAESKGTFGNFGRLTRVADLPSKSEFAKYVKAAMKLNEEGVKVQRSKSRPKTPVEPHPELQAALAKNKRAAAGLSELAPGQQREYLEWIAEAKRDETRARRIEQALEWLAEGKTRNWKYAQR